MHSGLAISILGEYVTECTHIASKDTYTIVQNSFIHNCQKLEIAQMSININKSLHSHTIEYHLAIKRMK